VNSSPDIASTSHPILDVHGLQRSFGGVEAVAGVDLKVETGELRCIIGPNGAGKSTLFKMLIGSVVADAGSIVFNGEDITQLPTHVRSHLGIGVKFQNLAIYSALTVRHNLRLPLQHRLDEPALAQETGRLLARLRLAGTEDVIAGALSHGQKQWLAIGMALAISPSLLLLDEPTAGMGPDETSETAELIKAVNREGVSVVIIEHDMEFVRQLGAPITVLHLGRVLAEGALGDIERNDAVRKIYLGTTKLKELRRLRKNRQ
jgi:branched-chain amino acid transport system ATP-binding protein